MTTAGNERADSLLVAGHAQALKIGYPLNEDSLFP